LNIERIKNSIIKIVTFDFVPLNPEFKIHV